MSRLIQKAGFLNPNRAGRYMNYIATRDGVELAGPRGDILWNLDKNADIRFSHENPDVQALYREYLGQPLSEKAHHLLHTDQRTWTL